MAPRDELQTVLEGLSEHVYFQPPVNLDMRYPCIVYDRAGDQSYFADNARYAGKIRYTVTVIDRSPDSPLWQKVWDLPYSRFERHFVADGLHHDVFNLFF